MSKVAELNNQMVNTPPEFVTRLAQTAEDVRSAQALRYKVFVEEMGADGAFADHEHSLERDIYDQHAEQLLLLDLTREPDDQVVGVYRVLDREGAKAAGQFYSETEFDLSPLVHSDRTVMVRSGELSWYGSGRAHVVIVFAASKVSCAERYSRLCTIKASNHLWSRCRSCRRDAQCACID